MKRNRFSPQSTTANAFASTPLRQALTACIGSFALVAQTSCGSSQPNEPSTANPATPGNTAGNSSANDPGAGPGANPSAGGAPGTDGTGGVPAVNNGGAPSTAGGAPSNGGQPAAGGAPPTVTMMSDDFVSGVAIEVDEDVNTILNVSWTQELAADQVSLEFTFEAGNILRSRARPGVTGEHTDVALGIPGDTEVTVRIVSRQGDTDFVSSDATATTGPIPAGFPLPSDVTYEASLASPNRYLFGSVEDSVGGSAAQANYFGNTFWLYVMDRQGRIVWYFSEPGSNATSSFQRIARDGEYIWIERRCFGCGAFDESVYKMTLDHAYFEEVLTPGLEDCIDVTTDGSLLYNTLPTLSSGQLLELPRGATQPRVIWDCQEYFGQNFNCYTNTINWNEADDTIMMSFPDPRTVLQINRSDGSVVGQYGADQGARVSYDFAPPLTNPPTAWSFGFQHFANLNAAGNLMLSSHMPGFENTTTAVANQHAFLEFAIDRQTQTLTEVWRYTDGPEWARSKGMAIEVPGSTNVLANYGTGGVIREITRDRQTVFYVKFDVEGGDDFHNKMVGNNVLIDDLYGLNGGGPQ